MALVIAALARVFQYNGLELPDIEPAASPAKVKDFYAGMYPELSTAEVEGPVAKADKLVYTFKRSVGTKGVEAAATKTKGISVPFVQRLAALADGQPDPCETHALPRIAVPPQERSAIARFCEALNRPGEPTMLPASAIALML